MSFDGAEEQNITECKVCKQLKIRIQDGMFNHKDKRWIGEDGTQWVGKKCPDCVREYNRIKQKEKNKYLI